MYGESHSAHIICAANRGPDLATNWHVSPPIVVHAAVLHASEFGLSVRHEEIVITDVSRRPSMHSALFTSELGADEITPDL